MKKLILKHRFASGNVLEVYSERIKRGEVAMQDCIWEKFPPSKEDEQEYQDTVQPMMIKAFLRQMGEQDDGTTD